MNYGHRKGPEEDPVVVRVRPPVSRRVGTRPKLSERSPLLKKTDEQGPLHLNRTRFVPGVRRVWPSALTKKQLPQKHKQLPESRTMSLILKDPEVEAVTPERSEVTKPLVKPAASQGNRQGGLSNVGPSQQPDVGVSVNSSESSRSRPKQEKKCMNKIKVTHIKLPHKDQRGSGTLRKDGAALVLRQTLASSSDSGDTSDSSAVSDPDHSPDPFNKLLTDSLTNLNITTFYLGQSRPPDHSAGSEAVVEQDFDGDKQSGYLPPGPGSPSTSPTPTPTHAVSTLPERPQSPASINHSSKDESSSGESKDPRTNIHQVSPEHKKQPMFQRSPAKSGFLHRTRQNNLHLKSSHHSSPHSNLQLQTQSNSTSMLEVKTSVSSPASDESLSTEELEQASDVKEHNARAQAEDEKETTPTETSRIAAHRLPLRRGYVRRPIPNVGPLRNRTHPNVRILPGPFKRARNASGGSDQHLPPSRLTATLSPPEDLNLTGGTKSREEEHHEVKTNVPTVLGQATLRGASSSDPAARGRYFRRPALNGGHLINNTNKRLKPPQRQHGESARNPLAFRWPSGQAAPRVGSNPRLSEEDTTPQTQGDKLEKQMDPTPAARVQHRRAEDVLVEQMEGHGANNSPHMDNLDGEKHLSLQTTNVKEDGTKVLDLHAETDKRDQKVQDGADQTRPQARKPFSTSRQGSPELVRPSVRLPPTRKSLLNQYINKTPNRSNTKMNNTAKGLLLEGKTEERKEAASLAQTGSDSSYSRVTREPLENVAVTNRTSTGFTLTWDSPEGKYEKFVVTRKETGKDEDAEQGGALKGEPRNDPSLQGSQLGNGDKEKRRSESVSRPASGDKPFQKVLASSARSLHFAALPPQTDHTVTLLGKGPGLLSRLHKLVISTGTNCTD